jgi:hypothetical protein
MTTQDLIDLTRHTRDVLGGGRLSQVPHGCTRRAGDNAPELV